MGAPSGRLRLSVICMVPRSRATSAPVYTASAPGAARAAAVSMAAMRACACIERTLTALRRHGCDHAVVVAGYCAGAIIRANASPDASMAELYELAGISPDLVAELTTFVYGGIAALVAVVQVMLARWHFAGGLRLQAFVEGTPAWVLELLGPGEERNI